MVVIIMASQIAVWAIDRLEDRKVAADRMASLTLMEEELSRKRTAVRPGGLRRPPPSLKAREEWLRSVRKTGRLGRRRWD